MYSTRNICNLYAYLCYIPFSEKFVHILESKWFLFKIGFFDINELIYFEGLLNYEGHFKNQKSDWLISSFAISNDSVQVNIVRLLGERLFPGFESYICILQYFIVL